MKRLPPRRLLCLLLTLVLVCSVIPVQAFADEGSASSGGSASGGNSSDSTAGYPQISDRDTFEKYIAYHNNNDNFSFLQSFYSNWSYDDALADILPEIVVPNTDPLYAEAYAWICGYVDRLFGIQRSGGHICVFSPFYNRTHHFLECTTGCNNRKKLTPHTLEGGKCVCGYTALDNATLTTLWLDNLRLTEDFDPEVTEYTAKPVTYKEVTRTRITAHSFDALATIDLPTDLEVAPGKVFKITVTAEDGSTTQTYTVTVAE